MRAPSTRATGERHLASAGVHPAKTWELDSDEAIKRAVAAGLGVAFLSRLVVQDELDRGTLIEMIVPGIGSTPRPVFLVRPADGELTPAQQAFIPTLTDCCATNVDACAVPVR